MQPLFEESMMDTRLLLGYVRDRRRDPEDRTISAGNISETRDKMLDKTLADSFPASDPPSSLPNPTEDSFALSSLPE